MESVALLERESDVAPWTCAGSVGPAAPSHGPRTRTWTCRSATTWRWRSPAGCCPPRTAGCSAAFAAQAAVVLDRQRLVGEAEQARELAEGNRIRTALLAAVSHDLRTPLAAIKAAVTSLRSDDVAWSEEDEAELLEAIEDGADRLDHLVGNLLDMSRLQTGTVTPLIRETDLDEVVPMALVGVPGEQRRAWTSPRRCRWSAVDRGLLERAVANVVENAVKYSPDGTARRWCPRAPSATASSCASPTAAPACPTTPRTGSSSRSSGTVTLHAAPESASASRSPAASSRPWAARSPPRTPPAAA